MSPDQSVYDGCDLADDGDSIYTATTLVGSENGARASQIAALDRHTRQPAILQRAVTLASQSGTHAAQGSVQSGSATPYNDDDAQSLASETSTLRNVPSATAAQSALRPQNRIRAPSGVSYSRHFQLVGPTDYSVTGHDESLPLDLRRASIDSTTTDVLHRSADAAMRSGHLVVPWWNTMLPSPLMNGSRTQSRVNGDATREGEAVSATLGVVRPALAQLRSRSQGIMQRESAGRMRSMSDRPETGRGAQSTRQSQPSVTDYGTSHPRPVVDFTYTPPSWDREPEQSRPANTRTPTSSQSRSSSSRQRSTNHSQPQAQSTTSASSAGSSTRGRTISAPKKKRESREKPNRGVHFNTSEQSGSNQTHRSRPMARTRSKEVTPPPLPDVWPLYTKCYCEENAYILAAQLLAQCQKRNARTETLLNAEGGASQNSKLLQWSVDVVFVSNESKTVALWQQRASALRDVGSVVVWDYHVFVTVTCKPREASKRTDAGTSPSLEQTWVYDLDSLLPVPEPLRPYIQSTFRYGSREQVTEAYTPRFRVVTAIDYLACFASNRSHMRLGNGEWSAQPPPWQEIHGPRAKEYNNLMQRYVDMSGGTQGIVVGGIVPQAEEIRSYGVVVSLDELAGDKQITGQPCFSRTSKIASRKNLDISHLLDRRILHLLADNGFELRPAGSMARNVPSQSHRHSVSSEQDDSESTPDDDDDDPRHNIPGMLLGGTRRTYGVRPPPPPPGQSELRFQSINFSGRGKRVSNALFPAYLHASLESRAQAQRDAAAAAAAAAASTPSINTRRR